jgi:sugar phosphate isomerase/epimerase
VGSTQITFDFLDRKRDWVLKFHQQLDCRLTSVSVLPLRVIRGNRESMLRFAEQLDALGAYYRQRGLQSCFHHHDFEFRHYGSELGLELLLGNTDPENVAVEMDTYWVARGGQSSQDLIRKLDGRVKLVQLRDVCLRWKPLRLAPVDCELGQGNLDFRAYGGQLPGAGRSIHGDRTGHGDPLRMCGEQCRPPEETGLCRVTLNRIMES